MALYHKYRPQKFGDIVSQEHIVKTLSNEVAAKKLAHAYLFSGPRGTGKTTTARILAKALNCSNRQDGKDEPCNSCASCQEISDSRSIDVIEIDAASHTGVENVRENIIDSAQFRPTKSKYKVFIIDEAHMLSPAAFNALLKTLEEPPAYVVFILATTELAKLPDTIVSRCQRFAFHRLPAAELKKYLEHIAKEEEVKIDKEVLERIVNKSEGAARDAISLLDQLMSTGEKTIGSEVASLVLPTANIENTLSLLRFIIKKDTREALTYLNKLVDEGVNLTQFSHDLLELLRSLLIIKASGQALGAGLDLDDKTMKELKKLAEELNNQELIGLIDLILIRRTQIKTAPLAQLPLEMAIIAWCGTTNTTNTNNNTNSEAILKTDNKEADKKEEKKGLAKIIVEKITSKNNIAREQIENKWNDFISRIEAEHPSLSFILKMAEIRGVSDNTLLLSVAHNFHRDKLMEKPCVKKLENIWEELLSEKIKFNVIVAERAAIPAEDKEIEELASSLGGEVL